MSSCSKRCLFNGSVIALALLSVTGCTRYGDRDVEGNHLKALDYESIGAWTSLCKIARDDTHFPTDQRTAPYEAYHMKLFQSGKCAPYSEEYRGAMGKTGHDKNGNPFIGPDMAWDEKINNEFRGNSQMIERHHLLREDFVPPEKALSNYQRQIRRATNSPSSHYRAPPRRDYNSSASSSVVLPPDQRVNKGKTGKRTIFPQNSQ